MLVQEAMPVHRGFRGVAVILVRRVIRVVKAHKGISDLRGRQVLWGRRGRQDLREIWGLRGQGGFPGRSGQPVLQVLWARKVKQVHRVYRV